MSLFGKVDQLQTGLNASSLRSDVIYNNIANVDTPDFNRSSVEFERLYKSAIESDGFYEKRTRDKHMEFGFDNDATAIVVEDTSTTMRMDGNNVDIDKEMVDLAQNVLYFQALSNQATAEFGLLNTAITGRS